MAKNANQSAEFSPSDAGTVESDWLGFFKSQPIWAPATEHLLIVSPHPDDEVLGVGGLAYTWASKGHRVTIVSVTDGEAADLKRPDLATVRRDELRLAVKGIAQDICIEHLGLPDGNVSDYEDQLKPALAMLIDSSSTLIAPYEHDGHPDHESVGRVCRELALTLGVPTARYPIWMWHHTTPDAVTGLAWGTFALASEAQYAKGQAVRCFNSQLRPTHGEPILPSQVLSHFDRPFEAFVL